MGNKISNHPVVRRILSNSWYKSIHIPRICISHVAYPIENLSMLRVAPRKPLSLFRKAVGVRVVVGNKFKPFWYADSFWKEVVMVSVCDRNCISEFTVTILEDQAAKLVPPFVFVGSGKTSLFRGIRRLASRIICLCGWSPRLYFLLQGICQVDASSRRGSMGTGGQTGRFLISKWKTSHLSECSSSNIPLVTERPLPYKKRGPELLLSPADILIHKIIYSGVDQKPGALGKSLKRLVDVTGFEPATPWLQTRCSPS